MNNICSIGDKLTVKKKFRTALVVVLAFIAVISLVGCEGGIFPEKDIAGLEFKLNEDGKSYTVGENGEDNVAEIEIPKKYKGKPVTTVGTFFCDNLRSLIIPDSVTVIIDGAFIGCGALESIEIPDSVNKIGEFTFASCMSLTSVVIGDGVTHIGMQAFLDCEKLESVTVGKGLIELGSSAFANCPSLKSVTLPEGLTTVADGAFVGCASLAEISIPESVTVIEDGAFERCTSLTKVNIPTGVTKLYGHVFYRCDSLEKVTYGGTVQEWKAIEKFGDWSEAKFSIVCTDGEISADNIK